MSEHSVVLKWNRDTPDFNYDTFSRNHIIEFGPVGKICASSAPEYHGDPTCLDPEQAFVTALASCHMLTFLAIACKKGYVIDNYIDRAAATLGKNKSGRMAITSVELKPQVTFGGSTALSEEEFKSLHDRAHRGCIISNSVADCVTVMVLPVLVKSA